MGFRIPGFPRLTRKEKEETYLAREFGGEYQRYARQVPQLAPFARVQKKE
jgi:protein-S-isoprenylcysteine O-methyltransferase Ste14